VLVDTDQVNLEETKHLISTPSFAYCADVSDEGRMLDLSKQVSSEVGLPRILVACAGILGPRGLPIWESTNEDWARVLSVNLYGTLNCVRVFAPLLENADGPSHIALLSSTVGLWAPRSAGIYAASKHALVSLAESLQYELSAANSSIGVSLICPRAVRTSFNAAVRTDHSRSRPTGSDYIEPDDVAVKVIDAIASGDFYVFTHDGTKEVLAAYYDTVLRTLE